MKNNSQSDTAFFIISGYNKEDKSQFENEIVYSFDSAPSQDDMDSLNVSEFDIFYFGLGEHEIISAIEEGEGTALNFVITSYQKLK